MQIPKPEQAWKPYFNLIFRVPNSWVLGICVIVVVVVQILDKYKIIEYFGPVGSVILHVDTYVRCIHTLN